jgi:hypothetical protein
MAKDQQLEIDAAEIRIRATRRLGEMMAVMPKQTGAHAKKISRGILYPENAPISLGEAGIDKNLAKAAREFAGLAEDAFEDTLLQWRLALMKMSLSQLIHSKL